MAAFALEQIAQTSYYIRLDSSVAGTDTDHRILLDAVRLHTDSQTAVIYEFQPETSELTAVASRSSNAARVKDVGVTLTEPTSQWFESLVSPVQGRPADPNFERFPEVMQYQLKRLMVVPLRTGNHIFGILTLGRVEDLRFDQAAIEVAKRAGQVLTAVQDYLLLRDKSLRRRTPMSNLAKGIIETYVQAGA